MLNAVVMSLENAYHGRLGDYFARTAGTSPFNAFTDRPAMLELAGDVAGLRILDVGCGAGHYTADLLDRGACVTGIDGSATLLRHAHERVGSRADLRLHDLDSPLNFAADASFDAAVCALVYHHIAARDQLLTELRRVVRPGGWLVLSTTHPTAEWHHHGGSYYDGTWVDGTLADPSMAIRYQRMTLEALMNEWLSAGFTLERLVEPRPLPQLREVDESRYDRLSQAPSFLAVRLGSP